MQDFLHWWLVTHHETTRNSDAAFFLGIQVTCNHSSHRTNFCQWLLLFPLLLLMVQKSGNQLRLVVEIPYLQGFIHPGWLLGISSINSISVTTMPHRFLWIGVEFSWFKCLVHTICLEKIRSVCRSATLIAGWCPFLPPYLRKVPLKLHHLPPKKTPGEYSSNIFQETTQPSHLSSASWAPTSYTWSYNHKCPKQMGFPGVISAL